MPNLRAIVLVFIFEAILSFLFLFSLYYGFTLFSFNIDLSSGSDSIGVQTTTTSISGSIPLYMPTLQDLKASYSYFSINHFNWTWASFLLTALIIVLQSFFRGMYLGGLKGAIVEKRAVPLLYCGKKFFKSMLLWSILQQLILIITIFNPILGMILYLFNIFLLLTPYLIVLQDSNFRDAINNSIVIIRKYFGKMLRYGFGAILITLIVSMVKTAYEPLNYLLPFILYPFIGTFLIREFLIVLIQLLKKENIQIPSFSVGEVKMNKRNNIYTIGLIPICVLFGLLCYSGNLFAISLKSNPSTVSGVALHSSYSSTFYASEAQYVTFNWDEGREEDTYTLEFKLPLFHEDLPASISGNASIKWLVDKEIVTTKGHNTHYTIEPREQEDKIIYRLVKQQAKDGSYYYTSSNNGMAGVVLQEIKQEKVNIHMMLSADGKSIFIVRAPVEVDLLSKITVSHDGNYLTIKTNEFNHDQVKLYWFQNELTKQNVLQFLKFKNSISSLVTDNNIDELINTALIEGDGNLLITYIEHLKAIGVNVKAPNWTNEEWSTFLLKQYDTLSIHAMLATLSTTNEQLYNRLEIEERSTDEYTVYELKVPLNNQTIVINSTRSKEDFTLKSLTIELAN